MQLGLRTGQSLKQSNSLFNCSDSSLWKASSLCNLCTLMFNFPEGGWSDCWLDFMDVWSEGIAMPIGALIMALMIGWELKPKFFEDEIKLGSDGKVIGFWGICMKFIVPIVMLFVLLAQLDAFFNFIPWI